MNEHVTRLENFLVAPDGAGQESHAELLFDAVVVLDHSRFDCPVPVLLVPLGEALSDTDIESWILSSGLITEFLSVLVRRNLSVLVTGSQAVTMVAAWMLKSTQANLEEVKKLIPAHLLDRLNLKILDRLEMRLPGKRLVMAQTVRPPQVHQPMVAAPAQPLAGQPGQMAIPSLPRVAAPPGAALGAPGSVESHAAMVSAQASGWKPAHMLQAVPPPQSGMSIAPIVGSQPGHPVSGPSTEQDRHIDAVLNQLGGHRPMLQGTAGDRPVASPGMELVPVILTPAPPSGQSGQGEDSGGIAQMVQNFVRAADGGEANDKIDATG